MSNPDTRAEAALADFVPMLDGRTRLLVRRGWEDAAEHLADPDAVPVDERLEGGREPATVTTLPGGARIVVRRYRRGGMMRWINRVHYFGGNRAFDELRATERARAGGVRAPVVVAAIERPGRVAGYRAWLATELVPAAHDLAAWLHHSGADEERRRRCSGGRAADGADARGGSGAPGREPAQPAGSGRPGRRGLPDRLRPRPRRRPPGGRGRRERDLRRLARSARKLWVIVLPRRMGRLPRRLRRRLARRGWTSTPPPKERSKKHPVHAEVAKAEDGGGGETANRDARSSESGAEAPPDSPQPPNG